MGVLREEEEEEEEEEESAQVVSHLSKARVLRVLFEHYCNLHETVTRDALNSRKFRLFAEDAGFVKPLSPKADRRRRRRSSSASPTSSRRPRRQLPLHTLDIIFSGAVESRAGLLMSEERFFEACGEIAQRLYGESDFRECLASFFAEFLMPLAGRVLQQRRTTLPPAVELSDEVRALFTRCEAPLHKIFTHYAELEPQRTMHFGSSSAEDHPFPTVAHSPTKQHKLPEHRNLARDPSLAVLHTPNVEMEERKGVVGAYVDPMDVDAAEAVRAARKHWFELKQQAFSTINFDEFSQFARDFCLFPDLVSHQQLSHIFSWAHHSGDAVQDMLERHPHLEHVSGDRSTLEYPDFLKSLVLIARQGFGSAGPGADERSDVEALGLLLLKLDDQGKVIGMQRAFSPEHFSVASGGYAAEPINVQDLLSPEHLSLLRTLFERACNPTRKAINHFALSRFGFAKFMRQAGIVVDPKQRQQRNGRALVLADVDIVYGHITHVHGATSNSSIDFQQFLLGLAELLVRLYPEQSLKESLAHACETRLQQLREDEEVYLLKDVAENEAEQVEQNSPLFDPDVRATLERHARSLFRVFERYARLVDTMHGAELYQTAFFKFARDFGVYPRLLNLKQLLYIFTSCAADDDTEAALVFDEFQEALVRIADAAFADAGEHMSHPTTLGRLELLLFYLDERGDIGFTKFRTAPADTGAEAQRKSVLELLAEPGW